MAKLGGNKVPEITSEEHIGPQHTGDNISAKKVANYVWNADSNIWERMASELKAGKDFDYIDVQQTNTTTETYIYKTGGSGGTTVQTVVVVYTDDSKNDIDTVTWS